MHKSATKCNETLDKWYKNKHGASKIMDTLETYQYHPHLAMCSNRTCILRIDQALIALLGFGANNKNLFATQPRNAQDLSISNAVTIS
jgi:hypothetical protein